MHGTGLIDGNVLFVDGIKIRANASRGKNYTKHHCEKELSEIDKRIDGARLFGYSRKRSKRSLSGTMSSLSSRKYMHDEKHG